MQNIGCHLLHLDRTSVTFARPPHLWLFFPSPLGFFYAHDCLLATFPRSRIPVCVVFPCTVCCLSGVTRAPSAPPTHACKHAQKLFNLFCWNRNDVTATAAMRNAQRAVTGQKPQTDRPFLCSHTAAYTCDCTMAVATRAMSCKAGRLVV